MRGGHTYAIVAILSVWILMLSCAAHASGTYADLQITVGSDGRAFVTGSTNVQIADIAPNDSLSSYTDALTAKRQNLWIFNLTTPDIVNVSVIKVMLPSDVVINAVKSSLPSNIEYDQGITITFVGKQIPLQIAIQYSFKSANPIVNKSSNQSSLAIYTLVTAAIVALVGLVTVLYRTYRTRPGQKIPIDMNKLDTLRPTLNETQLKIIDALIAAGGVATQNKIHHATQIPKASLSRNVDVLARKQILSKVSGGYTNQISFSAELLRK